MLQKILAVISIIYQILAKGHDLGLYNRDGQPINTTVGLKEHLKGVR